MLLLVSRSQKTREFPLDVAANQRNARTVYPRQFVELDFILELLSAGVAAMSLSTFFSSLLPSAKCDAPEEKEEKVEETKEEGKEEGGEEAAEEEEEEEPEDVRLIFFNKNKRNDWL